MANIILVAFVQVSALGTDPQDFDQAYHRSLTTGRPLVVLVGAGWCSACQKMNNSVLPQVAESGGLNKVVFTYVDFDQQRQLASRLSRGGSIPQLIRFDRTPAGWSSKRLVGARSPRDVYDFINAGLVDQSKVSQNSAADRPGSKPAPRDSVPSTPAASESATDSPVDGTTDHPRQIGPSPVEKWGDLFPRIVFFKKTLRGSKNRYDSTAHGQGRPSQATEEGEAGLPPGPREASAEDSESAGAGADILGLFFRFGSGSPASQRDSRPSGPLQPRE